jgi:hypothetical protein
LTLKELREFGAQTASWDEDTWVNCIIPMDGAPQFGGAITGLYVDTEDRAQKRFRRAHPGWGEKEPLANKFGVDVLQIVSTRSIRAEGPSLPAMVITSL